MVGGLSLSPQLTPSPFEIFTDLILVLYFADRGDGVALELIEAVNHLVNNVANVMNPCEIAIRGTFMSFVASLDYLNDITF